MKRIYSKPVLTVESFVTDEIMETNNPYNILSYNEATGQGGYDGTAGFIKFQNDPDNVLHSIDYSQFNPQD